MSLPENVEASAIDLHQHSTSETALENAQAGLHTAVNVEGLASDAHVEMETADPKPPQRTWLIMLALCTTMFVVSLNTFLMTTALPTIAVDFATSDTGYAWMGSAYMLAFGVVVPVWANLSNVFGRRIILIIANSFFFVGTLTGALSRSSAILIAGRAIQGSGGGGLTVLVNLCVGDLFNLRERGLYFGIVGAVMAIASASGPSIGGVLTQSASWRWCFWINVPFIAISFVLLVFLLKIQTVQISFLKGLKSVDWLGIITIVGATLMLLLGLQLGGTVYPWNSARIVCLLVFGIVTFGIFALIERKGTHPLLPLRFFGRLSRLAILGVNVSQSLITTACTYFLPLYFQLGLGVSALRSGIYFLPTTLTLAVCFLCIGHVVKKTGDYVSIIRCGACALTLGTGLLIDSQPYISWPRVIISQIVVAIGLGLTYQAPLIAFHAQIDVKDVATGTSTFQFIKTLSQTVSVILGQVIFQSQVADRAETLRQSDLPYDLIATLSGGNAISSVTTLQGLSSMQREAVKRVLVAALRDMWIFYTVIAFLGFLSSLGIAKMRLT